MKIVLILIPLILTVVIAYFAFNAFNESDPLNSDKHMNYWVAKCGNDSKCKESVTANYSTCIDSLSFEKPNMDASTPTEVEKKKAVMDEYLSLVKVEIAECLSDKTGMDLPTN